MEIVDTTFPPLDNKLAWCFALLGVALLILLQPLEQCSKQQKQLLQTELAETKEA